MISFKKVSKSFGQLSVLENVSFDIANNEVVSILGPSGIGKTTILNLILGEIQPDSGTINVHSAKFGYVFQEPRLLPWRTAFENVFLVLRAKGINKKDSQELAFKWLSSLGLGEFENYYPEQLSGGMKQRVSLCRAFAVDPDILVLDEPFNGIDQKLRNTLLNMVKEMIRKKPMTVVYVTHNLSEALCLADRVFELHQGTGIRKLNVNDRDVLIQEYVSSLLEISSN